MSVEVREASRAVWRREIATQALWSLQGPLRLVPQVHGEKDDKYNFMGAVHSTISKGLWDLDQLLQKSNLYLELIGPPESENVSGVLRRSIDSLRSGEAPSEYIFGDLHHLSQQNHTRLSNIEPGLAKAKGYLMALLDVAHVDADSASCEAMCLLQDDVSDALVTTVVQGWKETVRAGKERDAYMSAIFWNSRDHEEAMDLISYYRFLELFEIGEFPRTIDEIETDFQDTLMMPASWVIAAQFLWLIGRSKGLLAKMRPFAERSLTEVCRQQHDEGWWPRLSQDHLDEPRPSFWTTALACVAIFRVSRDEAQLERAREGARWLAQQQQQNGAWRHAPGGDAYAQQEQLHTTLLACEAIRNLNSERYRSSLAGADAWIRSKQTPSGIWEAEPPLSPTAMTVEVIEYLDRGRPPSRDLSDYLVVARDFALRAQEVALENNPNAWRLAVVIAFQGVESFLYACLEHPSINLPIFEGRHTVGLRKALRSLEKSLQSTGSIPPNKSVSRRNQIDRLAYLRDEVVHKGAAVGREDARRLTNQVERFMDETSRQVFGFSLP